GLIAADGGHLRLRHPLLRSAIYRGAPLGDRLAAHRALAATMTTPDRADLRAWHVAQAATAPDDEVAAALEATAERARLRNGHHGAVAAYERAAALRTDEATRIRRLVLAAETATEAGEFDSALRAAARAEDRTRDPSIAARLDLVRGSAEFGAGRHRAAHRRLLTAAAAITAADAGLAARLLGQAMHVAWYLGEDELAQTAAHVEALGADAAGPALPVVLAGLRGGRTGDLRAAAETIGDPRALVLLCGSGLVPGQDEQVRELALELVGRCREEGRIGLLPPLLFFLAEAETFLGRPGEGVVLATESARIAADTGQGHWVSQSTAFLAYLAALGGRAEECARAAERAVAEEAADRLGVWAERSGLPWVRGLERRGRALLTEGPAAEELFEAALAAQPRPFEEARTRLLFGEWLRRAKRRTEARAQLRSARDQFAGLRARPWARRAELELGALGDGGRARPASGPLAALTPQELQIVRLAARGMSNRDIAAQLFLSQIGRAHV